MRGCRSGSAISRKPLVFHLFQSHKYEIIESNSNIKILNSYLKYQIFAHPHHLSGCKASFFKKNFWVQTSHPTPHSKPQFQHTSMMPTETGPRDDTQWHNPPLATSHGPSHEPCLCLLRLAAGQIVSLLQSQSP